jgi:O-antigen ligase
LTVVSPWPFGSVHPLAVNLVSIVALLTVAVTLAWERWSRALPAPAVPFWPVLALLGLALLHCVPLPPGIHALLAPGSAAFWHPDEPAVVMILGGGAHPIAVDPGSAFRWLALTAGLVGLAVLSAPALRRPGTAQRAALAVVIGGVAVSTYGVFARARFGSLLYGHIPVPTVHPFGPFVSKNHFAGYVAMTALLALGLLVGLAGRGGTGRAFRDWTRGPRAGGVVLALVAALAMTLAVLVSLSRGGMLSLLGGGLAFLAMRWTLRRPSGPRGWAPLVASAVLGIFLATLLGVVLPREAHERMRSIATPQADSSGSFRLDTWQDSLRLALASPWVGHGMGSFHDAFPRHKRGYGEERVEHAENDYLEMLVEGGLLGFGLTVLAVLLLGVRSWRGVRETQDPLLRGIGVGALAGLSGLALHSAVDFNLRIPSNAVLAAFLVALAASLAPPRPSTFPAAGAWAAVLSASLAVGGLLVLRPVPWALAQGQVAAAAAAWQPETRRLRAARAEYALRSVVRSRPAHAESWLLLAWTRAAQGDRTSVRPLANHAVSLDPQREAMREGAAQLITWAGMESRGEAASR